MRIQTISKKSINRIKQGLNKLFENVVESVQIECFCPSKVISILESLGADVSEEIDTNGWQYDYWIKFNFKGKKYNLSGSGYYGNVEISKSNE